MPSVDIRGNTDLRKALRTFAPDLEKTLRSEMKAGLVPVVKQARGFVPSDAPMSGWAARSFSEARFPFYNAQTIRAGIGYSTLVSKPNKNGFTSMARIFNQSGIGAIYETAGRKNPNGQAWVGPKAGGSSKGVSRSSNPKAGQQFIDNLDPIQTSLKGRGRLIYRAWAANRGITEGIVNKAVDKAITQFYARNLESKFSRAA
jgi:hypothetical protein